MWVWVLCILLWVLLCGCQCIVLEMIGALPWRHYNGPVVRLSAAMSVYENTNGMPMAEGRNLHMQTAPGEVANLIIAVGTASRANVVASLFDSEPEPITINSSRGFLTITGYYHGIRVSVVAIGMGPSMMDFFVREARAVVEGPMAIVRFGTCGGIVESAAEGTVVVANGGSSYVCRNYDFFPVDPSASCSEDPYKIHKIAPSDPELSASLISCLEEAVGTDKVQGGVNVTADSFYSTQNRIDPNFDDLNTDVLSKVCSVIPDAKTMEMESFVLLHLAQCSNIRIRACACAIVVANRVTARVVDEASFGVLELNGGRAVLNALTKLAM